MGEDAYLLNSGCLALWNAKTLCRSESEAAGVQMVYLRVQIRHLGVSWALTVSVLRCGLATPRAGDADLPAKGTSHRTEFGRGAGLLAPRPAARGVSRT